MNEIWFLLWLQAVALTILIPCERIPIALRCWLALPIGLVMYVAAGLVALLLGVFSFWLIVLAVSSVALLLAWRARARMLLDRREVLVLGAVVGITVIVGFASHGLHLTKMSEDSIQMVVTSSAIAQGVSFADLPTVLAFPLFISLAHTPAFTLTGDFHIEALTPALGVACLASFAMLVREVLRERGSTPRESAVVLWISTLAAASGFLVIYQIFYVNGHLLFALFLAVFVVSAWLTAMRGDPQWAVLMVPALTSLAMLRLEGPIVATLAVVPFVATEAIPFRVRLVVTSTFGVFVLALFGTYFNVGRAGRILDDGIIATTLLATLGLLALLALSRWRRARGLVRISPWVLLVVLAAAAAAVTALEPQHMGETASAMVENVIRSGQWGATLIGLLVLVVIAAFTLRIRFSALWFVPVLGFVPLIYAMAYFRKPYRVGWGDSANRMMTHILFLAVMFVALAAVQGAFASRESQEPQALGADA